MALPCSHGVGAFTMFNVILPESLAYLLVRLLPR